MSDAPSEKDEKDILESFRKKRRVLNVQNLQRYRSNAVDRDFYLTVKFPGYKRPRFSRRTGQWLTDRISKRSVDADLQKIKQNATAF